MDGRAELGFSDIRQCFTEDEQNEYAAVHAGTTTDTNKKKNDDISFVVFRIRHLTSADPECKEFRKEPKAETEIVIHLNFSIQRLELPSEKDSEEL